MEVEPFDVVMKRHFDNRRHAENKLWREFWYDRLIDMGFMECPNKKIEEEMSEWLKEKSSYKKTKYKYMMATINFKPGIELEMAIKKINKCLKKKWIVSWYWCMEWRSIDMGMHCHIRIETDGKKNCYQCKREVYNTFKNLVGNKKHVRLDYGIRKDSFINYVKGIKLGKPKSTSEINKIMRLKFNLINFYNGRNIKCREEDLGEERGEERKATDLKNSHPDSVK